MTDNEIEKKLEPYYNNWSRKKQIVTVFLRTHKRPQYLSIMIDSILKQTYSNFYLIVLDNMSGDNTREVIESFKDDRIIYLERESNPNVETSNFEFAFKICKTKYLAVFHDDDILDIYYLEKMLGFMEEGNYQIGAPLFNIIDEDGSVTWSDKKSGKTIIYHGTDYIINSFTLMKSHGILFPASIYEATFFRNISQFYDRAAGPSVDNYLCMQTERFGGKMAVKDEVLYFYRKYHNQVSSNHKNVVTMHLILITFLLRQDYYYSVLKPYLVNFRYIVVNSSKQAILFFVERKIKRKDLKLVYNNIPRVLKKRRIRVYSCCLLLAYCLPRVFLLILYRILKHY